MRLQQPADGHGRDPARDGRHDARVQPVTDVKALPSPEELAMRALNGSIITAGALIGLGLCAVGLGLRYQNVGTSNPSSIVYIKWVQLDTPMMLLIVALLSMAVIGLATAFLGLAYHHERRNYERRRAASEPRGGALP
jgi:hypothetical protein